jgi:hypothetical protein
LELASASGQRIWILVSPEAGFQEWLASKELVRGLRNLGLAREPIQAVASVAEPGSQDIVFTLVVNKEGLNHPEAYEITTGGARGGSSRVLLQGATPQAVLYSVFDFLERQGAFFGLDGEVYPLEPVQSALLPGPNDPWRGKPRFGTRGLLPWPDFLNCITVFNREEFRAYLEAMVRMRFNTLGIHVYSAANQWTESFLSFEYAGAGHLAFTDTSATNRWGYLPERTSRYGMGAADFYAGEVFGSEATTKATSCWEDEELAQALWGEALRYAHDLGVKTGVGFEPYQIPDEIFRACPPEARYITKDPKAPGPRINPDSAAARDILETRLARLLETYPTVDYVWLWEDEEMNWASQKGNVPFSVTPYQQAYDFLRRHAPNKRLVLSGWGGVVRHFAHFHKTLPEDVIFASLNDNLGWDPVSEEYGRLGSRERWPIPWLEDDPGMWLPQFHVHRFVRDMDLAEQYGCQGTLGIHWRHRIMDANAGFQSRYSWDKSFRPADHFQSFARSLVRKPVAEKLAQVLTKTDRDRLILDSFTGEIKNGHHQIHEFSGDYNEAVTFWNDYEPSQKVKESQAEVAEELRALTTATSSPAERERINYLTRHIEFLVPYSKSWSLAHHLHAVLLEAGELRKQGKTQKARSKVLNDGVPLWLKLAPQVREALLDFQEIVSTRNDLGTLASMHNKFERLALYRLRASMKEYLRKLPSEVDDLFRTIQLPDYGARLRVFIPTRPTVFRKGESARIFAVASGPAQVERVCLFTRSGNVHSWQSIPMHLIGRKTYQTELEAPEGSPPFLDYYVRAEFKNSSGEGVDATAPLEAPSRFYTVTLT